MHNLLREYTVCFTPQKIVPVDLKMKAVEQRNVEQGHSPWKLDPVFVAQVFTSILISPKGIIGDYPIAYNEIEILHNSGTDAIAEIHNDKSAAKYVYLKKLIRKDNVGIWSVIGYDPAD